MALRNHAFVLAVFLIVAQTFKTGESAPALATDVFISPCPRITNPVYKLWSSSDTWPDLIVPGLDLESEELKNVVIPCGMAVLLDVPNIKINGVLHIQGLLSVMDNATVPTFYVKVHHVLVEGQLVIGSFAKQFGQKITFELIPHPENEELQFSSFEPADPDNARFLGEKAFVVVGGQADLHGMPGGKDTPSWCFLAATAMPGATSVVVDCPLAIQWPIGGQIVVTTTDYDYLQSENVIITNVSLTANKKVLVNFSKPLLYMHNGVNVSDGMGGWVDERGEVALVSRNIKITGTDEPADRYFIGGHFMIFMTGVPQFIEGVEFYKMGQQGRLGRYSLHFHVHGYSPQTIALKNSIHQSKQRCIVVHATHSMTVKENVAFNSTGHCFSLEEGGEQNNIFDSNIAITGVRALRIIPTESDFNPAQYWISAPSNIHINNRAVGSLDSGFWWETRSKVRGMSLQIPSLQNLIPDSTIIKVFKGNVAHSCHNVGMKTYPDGFKPVIGNAAGLGSKIENVLIYKQSSKGFLFHQSQFLTISGTFADCGVGILVLENRAIHIRNSRFVGLTSNYGNPDKCYARDARDYFPNCAPTEPGVCTMPLPPTAVGRSHSGYYRDGIYGIQISQERRINAHTFPCKLSNISFSLFNYTCSRPGVSAGITTVQGSLFGSSFNPHFNFQGIKSYTNSLPIYLSPRTAYYEQLYNPTDMGQISEFTVMKDLDGSLIGKPGSLVANNTALTISTCTYLPKFNAYGCPGTCYRSVRLEYDEPGFQLSNKKVNVNGNWSYMRVTRLSDNKTFVHDGNLNDPTSTASYPTRVYYLVLLSNDTYDITIVGPNSNRDWYPSGIKFNYIDDLGACNGSVRLRIAPPSNPTLQWLVDVIKSPVMSRTCDGATPESPTDWIAQYNYTCLNRTNTFDVELPPFFPRSIFLYPAVGQRTCQVNHTCTVFRNFKSDWLWDTSGLERRPAFYDPKASNLTFFNRSGAGAFGFNNIFIGLNTTLGKPTASLVTYYFRRNFTLSNTSCFSSLVFQIHFEDGILVYLNGKEIIRNNMPNGTITTSTFALIKQSQWMIFQNYTMPFPAANNAYGLVEGNNTVAAEVHIYNRGAKRALFDMQIFGTRKNIQCGLPLRP